MDEPVVFEDDPGIINPWVPNPQTGQPPEDPGDPSDGSHNCHGETHKIVPGSGLNPSLPPDMADLPHLKGHSPHEDIPDNEQGGGWISDSTPVLNGPKYTLMEAGWGTPASPTPGVVVVVYEAPDPGGGVEVNYSEAKTVHSSRSNSDGSTYTSKNGSRKKNDSADGDEAVGDWVDAAPEGTVRYVVCYQEN